MNHACIYLIFACYNDHQSALESYPPIKESRPLNSTDGWEDTFQFSEFHFHRINNKGGLVGALQLLVAFHSQMGLLNFMYLINFLLVYFHTLQDLIFFCPLYKRMAVMRRATNTSCQFFAHLGGHHVTVYTWQIQAYLLLISIRVIITHAFLIFAKINNISVYVPPTIWVKPLAWPTRGFVFMRPAAQRGYFLAFSIFGDPRFTSFTQHVKLLHLYRPLFTLLLFFFFFKSKCGSWVATFFCCEGDQIQKGGCIGEYWIQQVKRCWQSPSLMSTHLQLFSTCFRFFKSHIL